jgi:hypothetical protein
MPVRGYTRSARLTVDEVISPNPKQRISEMPVPSWHEQNPCQRKKGGCDVCEGADLIGVY